MPRPAFGPIDSAQRREEVMQYCNDQTVHECQHCGPDNASDCARLVEKINNLANDPEKGLAARFGEQFQAIRDARNQVYNGLCPPGTKNFANHNRQIRDQQNALRQRLRDFDDHQPPCNPALLNNGVREYVERGVPSEQPHHMEAPGTPMPRPGGLRGGLRGGGFGAPIGGGFGRPAFGGGGGGGIPRTLVPFL